MNFPRAIASGFTNYVTFKGRSSRAAYWYWVLFYVLLDIACAIIDSAFFIDPIAEAVERSRGPIELIFLLLTALPTIAVSVRRLHDIDRRGWWVLIGVIPIIGLIVLVIWYCTQGTEGDNRFGPDPLASGQ